MSVEGLGKRWSFEEVRLMTTDGIIDKLASVNIPFDQTHFLGDVRNHYSAEALGDTWLRRHKCTVTGFDEDFVWMAAIVLWERLAPDIVNVEMIDDEMKRDTSFLKGVRPVRHVTSGCTCGSSSNRNSHRR